jgi:uncharacterized protein YbjQ (UPF0145 family)
LLEQNSLTTQKFIKPQINYIAMIISTTPSLEGYQIDQYLGIVSGETIIGANIFKDFFASITDIVGGRSSAYEQVLREAKATAITEMELQARQFGANAIVGIDLDYETIRDGMLMVTVSGTAVKTTKL